MPTNGFSIKPRTVENLQPGSRKQPSMHGSGGLKVRSRSTWVPPRILTHPCSSLHPTLIGFSQPSWQKKVFLGFPTASIQPSSHPARHERRGHAGPGRGPRGGGGGERHHLQPLLLLLEPQGLLKKRKNAADFDMPWLLLGAGEG